MLWIGIGLSYMEYKSWRWRADPAAAFQEITGKSLPSAIHAVAFASQYTDNLFYESRYWLLHGSAADLRQLGRDSYGPDGATADLPDMKSMFNDNHTTADIAETYSVAGGRWPGYVIFMDGSTALYVY